MIFYDFEVQHYYDATKLIVNVDAFKKYDY